MCSILYSDSRMIGQQQFFKKRVVWIFHMRLYITFSLCSCTGIMREFLLPEKGVRNKNSQKRDWSNYFFHCLWICIYALRLQSSTLFWRDRSISSSDSFSDQKYIGKHFVYSGLEKGLFLYIMLFLYYDTIVFHDFLIISLRDSEGTEKRKMRRRQSHCRSVTGHIIMVMQIKCQHNVIYHDFFDSHGDWYLKILPLIITDHSLRKQRK